MDKVQLQNKNNKKSFLKEHKQTLIRWCALALVIIMVASTVVGAVIAMV